MKKVIIISIIFFIISCVSKQHLKAITSVNDVEINDSIKDKYEVLNDFLNNEIKNHSEKIMIMSKKIRNETTLNIIKINDIAFVDEISRKPIAPDNTFYKIEEWEKARNQYISDINKDIANKSFKEECCWRAENFDYKNIIFENLRQGTKEFNDKHISSPYYMCYYFSDPLYYKNKEYLIFTVFDGHIFDAMGGSSYIIIYKKKNGKWIQTHIGYPDWFT